MAIDINSATKQEFRKVPGIGKTTAEKIVGFREENGCFVDKTELRKIEGIGDGIYKQIGNGLACGSVDLEGTMTRQTYRRHNQTRLDSLKREHRRDFHVGHIVAENNGGPNHPDNYCIVAANVNMSIQDKHDDIMFWLAGREKTAQAVRAARIHSGYKLTVAEAEKIRHQAEMQLSRQFVEGVDQGVAENEDEECVGGAVGGAGSVLDWVRAQVEQEYCELIIDTWNDLCQKATTA